MLMGSCISYPFPLASYMITAQRIVFCVQYVGGEASEFAASQPQNATKQPRASPTVRQSEVAASGRSFWGNGELQHSMAGQRCPAPPKPKMENLWSRVEKAEDPGKG